MTNDKDKAASSVFSAVRFGTQDAYVGQVAITLVVVKSVAYHKFVGYGEAAPMIIPTAISITLPRMANFLNSLKKFLNILPPFLMMKSI